MKLVTVENVPLMKVGTWDASTGTASVTEDDLTEMVDAFNSGELDLPVIKIGHLDDRFDNPEWDGEPAYGQVGNLHLSEDAQTLLGDYINMPEDLAGKLASAYPNRSVEFYRGVKMRDAAGKVVKTFKVVLTALALLGATAPAVMGLGDVHAAFSTGDVDEMVALSAAQFAFPGGLTGNALREALDGALVAALKDAPDSPESVAWDVWVMDYDDTHIWYRADGVIYQRGYTIDGGSAVTLAPEMTPVAEERTFKPLGPPVPADTAPVPPATAASTDADTDSTPRGEHEFKETTTVDILAKLRELFGLPADADDQAVLDAATAAKTAEDAAAAAGTNASGTEPTDSVKVSALAFSNLQESVQNLSARNKVLEDAAIDKRRDEIIATAFSEGRLTGPETASWRTALDSSEETTVALLAARTPVFNTIEIGHSANLSGDQATAHAQAIEAEENRLFGIS
ncbi:phage protease [Pseudarthrobacter sp. P1]|uniref:phage protease n=1 Tax=Pseudarthrobacter sp. P1 TaxID=3418418 RepID=UPI003CE99460